MKGYDFMKEYEYKGFHIVFNFYGHNEYTVQCDGDDVIFMTGCEAMDYIDEVIAND